MGPECGNASHEIGKVLLLLVDERIKVHVLTLDAVELEWEGHKHYPGVTAVRAICLCATFLVMMAPSTYSESRGALPGIFLILTSYIDRERRGHVLV